MEVDEDVEAGLLRQFNCMLTTDKEVLVKELQTLVGAHLNEHTAKFYLEMNDWNLQAAVCAYFDLQSFNKLPQMTFLKDITIGEGESVPPSTRFINTFPASIQHPCLPWFITPLLYNTLAFPRFIKTWRIQNTGEEGWPSGCSLVYTGGELMGAPSRVSVAPLAAREVADISVDMVSPGITGLYSSKWRMTTAQGSFYGDTIWVIVQVDSGGTLALMQQMVNLKELGGCPPPTATTHTTTTTNPFAPNHNLHHPNVLWHPRLGSSPWHPRLGSSPWHPRLGSSPWHPRLGSSPWHPRLGSSPWHPKLMNPSHITTVLGPQKHGSGSVPLCAPGTSPAGPPPAEHPPHGTKNAGVVQNDPRPSL
ncbi:hypothetical protein GWK47_000294 [Chionoecetes opilio]|uniref:Nbr1 FW domain-containing protein n=1 Tax=Chionoecetes opilio TaxID=41210 RepID=A0A8J4YL78_CHIOP|nr:hypothetical protein GWK47_000294 [Chionoecetes opilio]